MSLQLILGAPGTGKTACCLRAIAEKRQSGAALYYLIPEQFSLQAEKLLTSPSPAWPGESAGAPGGTAPAASALLHVQALSFNRLAYQLLARLGAPPGKRVDELGRSMLLRKCLLDCAGQLTFYRNSADKQGFIDGLAHTITELNQYGARAEDLLARAETAPAELKAKLTDLSIILTAYRVNITGRYLSPDDMLDALYTRLEDSDILNGSYFWADGFTGFTPQERKVLSLILRSSVQAIFTFTTQAREYPEACHTLAELAARQNIPRLPDIWLETDHRHARQPALRCFTQYFTQTHTRHVWKGPAEGIEMVSAADRYAEVYEAARRIEEWVREKNYRYRDIALLCGGRAGYEKILQNAFDRRRIPLFIDTKADALSHPLTELIRTALEIAVRNWPYESVFRFLKTRLTPLTADEIDVLENYALRYGIQKYRWQYPFTSPNGEADGGPPQDETPRDTTPGPGGETPRRAAGMDIETAEAARAKLMDMLQNFTRGQHSDKTETVLSFSRRVYDLLYALRAPDTLLRWHAERTAAGDHETARKHRQIWPKLNEVFDKLTEILGGEKMTLAAFARVLDAGLAQADLGLIPPSVDQVFLGDIERSRFPEIKALLVLGANENKLPPLRETGGLFTEDERAVLRGASWELAPDANRRAEEDYFALYCVLCRPAETLVISHARAETSGKALKPARWVKRIKEMFPLLTETSAENEPNGLEPPAPSYAVPVQLLPETAARLYGPTVVTAASRLEQFRECPFAYFVTYNLKARERKIYQVQPADLGVIFHEVLSAFSRQLAEEGAAWGDLPPEEIKRRVERCVEDAVLPEAALRSTARNQHILRKVKRICTTSVWALCEQAKRGAFEPAGAELDFKSGAPITTLEVRLNGERKLVLTGRIDRVDILRDGDGNCYVKIIDYKSGRKKFDISEVLMGTQLQLMLYMGALLKNARALFGGAKVEAKPGGVFYFHIDDPVLPGNIPLGAEEREELLLKCFRLSGLALAEDAAITGMDRTLADGGESAVIPVTINKNGAYGKASSIADAEEFERLGRAVEEKIKEIGRQMTEGVIVPDPYTQGRFSACDYCRYGAVCGHYARQ